MMEKMDGLVTLLLQRDRQQHNETAGLKGQIDELKSAIAHLKDEHKDDEESRVLLTIVEKRAAQISQEQIQLEGALAGLQADLENVNLNNASNGSTESRASSPLHRAPPTAALMIEIVKILCILLPKF